MLNKIFKSLTILCFSFSSFVFGDDFKSTYSDWKDPRNTFVSYIKEFDQARVVFCGSQVASHDDDGQIPTVSEGMGYGLLLSYANDDQALFDQFLRYVLATAGNYGCSNYDPVKNVCYASSPFLMPWIVNKDGKPFNYIPDPTNPSEYYYSNGSATDADIQIAWAVYLAANKVKAGSWSKSTFKTVKGELGYEDIFLEMAHEIRLYDIDLTNLRLSPGSQWGAAGKTKLYPGYITPQALSALNTAPKPDVSTNIPTTPPTPPVPIVKPADLQIVYKSNVAASVSIDYMGGAGNLTAGENFHPKPTTKNGYTVDPVTTAVATMKTVNDYYNNATISAALYDASGQKTIYCSYEIVYNNNQWTVTDKGSSPSIAKCVMQGNVAYVFLTQDGINQVCFDYNDVQKNCIQAIADFQTWKNSGLIPNILYYDKQYPSAVWSNSYAFDACRFPLWVGAYVAKNPSETAMKEVLENLLKTLKSHIEKGPEGYTLPSQGVNALTGENVGDFNSETPPLDATLYVAYKLLGDAEASDLEEGVLGYDLKQLQPTTTDKLGDSTPYFNAALTLISEAVVQDKLK